ncbi:MAG: acyl-CoA dehydrogenase family protein [Candidatus Zixiibacteriota bacterium]
MDFNLSEDQLMFQEAGREFAEKRLFPIAEELDEKGETPKELLAEVAELGFFGLLAPEEYGGVGIDTLSYALVIEEISKACAGLAISISVHNSLVIKAIEMYGSEALKQEYLPKLAAGEIIGAYSLSEPGSGTDAGSLTCRAVADGDYYILNGTKNWVSTAGHAGVFVVFVSTNPEAGPKGISALVVPAGIEGLTLGANEKKMGMKCSDTRELSFMDAKVPKANLLLDENVGFKVALSLLDNGRIGIGAQALGIAKSAFKEAMSYSKERKQFGKAICNFQAIQFKLAEMATRIDQAELMLYRAAVLKDSGERHSREISMAKLVATQTANFVADEAVQIHGGYGYVKEYAVERYFRDARVTEIYEGTSEAQKIVISRDLLKE